MGSQVMQTTFATDMEAQHPPPSNNRARAVIGGLVTITLAVAAVVALSSGSPTSMTNDAATDAATELNARDCFSMKQYTCPLAWSLRLRALSSWRLPPRTCRPLLLRSHDRECCM